MGIAGKQVLSFRVHEPIPDRPKDGHRQGLGVPGWTVDQQPFDVTSRDTFQMITDGVKVPPGNIGTGFNRSPQLLLEVRQTDLRQCKVDHLGCQ